jgi:putative transposase
MESYGKPQAIRCDNGPEISSRHFLPRAIEETIDVVHIRPGKPTENAYVESFHGTLRDECLNVSWFWNLFNARRKMLTSTMYRNGDQYSANAARMTASSSRIRIHRNQRHACLS